MGRNCQQRQLQRQRNPVTTNSSRKTSERAAKLNCRHRTLLWGKRRLDEVEEVDFKPLSRGCCGEASLVDSSRCFPQRRPNTTRMSARNICTIERCQNTPPTKRPHRCPHVHPIPNAAVLSNKPNIVSLFQIRRCQGLHHTRALTKPGPKNSIRVLKHAVFQTNNNKLTPLEPRLYQASDILRMR